MPAEFQKPEFEGRTILVKKLKMLPYELIIRGYMFGSMWKSYKAGEPFCGHKIEGDYELAQKLEKPILTPSTKSSEGHDINISIEEMKADIGAELAEQIEDVCLKLFDRCCTYAAEKGIIIADTKLEFGLDEDGKLVLADEVFTPDSSRFWDGRRLQGRHLAEELRQAVCAPTGLIENKLDGVTPPPELPAEIIEKTREKYMECMKRIVG